MKIKHINIIILLAIIIVFGLQYYLTTSYIYEVFQNTSVGVRNDTIYNELKSFKMYLVENFIFLFLQSFGMLLCLNIGFLFFKLKVSLKNTINLVVLSLLATIIYQLLIIFYVKFNNWIFTISSLYAASEKLNIVNYINIEETAPWVELSLSSINLEQLLIIIILGISIHKIVKINYISAFSFTIRTYGLGLLLWFVFAMVMEMNFS